MYRKLWKLIVCYHMLWTSDWQQVQNRRKPFSHHQDIEGKQSCYPGQDKKTISIVEMFCYDCYSAKTIS